MGVKLTETEELADSYWLRASRYAALLTVGGLWTYVFRWHYGPLPTTLLEHLILATVLFYVVGAWRAGRRWPVRTGYELPIALLLAAGAIAVLVAKSHRDALGLYRAYFLEPIAFFYVASDLLRRTEQWRHVLIALGLGSSVFAVLNVVAFLRAAAAGAVQVGAAPNALYGDANYVAMYFDPIIALATGVVLFGGSVRSRWLGAGWLLLTGGAQLLMFSKGSYVAVGAIGVMAVLAAPRRRFQILAGLILGAALLSLVPAVQYRIATASGSILGRAEIFTATLKMIRDSPLLGVGLGGFSYQFRGAIPEVYPHDIWLTFWVELGLLGLVAFAIILFSLIWRAGKSIRLTSGFDRAVLWGVLAALIAWTVHGFVDSPYWKNDMSMEFWMLAALEVAVIRAAASPNRVQSP